MMHQHEIIRKNNKMNKNISVFFAEKKSVFDISHEKVFLNDDNYL